MNEMKFRWRFDGVCVRKGDALFMRLGEGYWLELHGESWEQCYEANEELEKEYLSILQAGNMKDPIVIICSCGEHVALGSTVGNQAKCSTCGQWFYCDARYGHRTIPKPYLPIQGDET